MTEQFKRYLKRVPNHPQRQDGTRDQLRDLIVLANKAGLYDAADFVRDLLEKNQSNQ